MDAGGVRKVFVQTSPIAAVDEVKSPVAASRFKAVFAATTKFTICLIIGCVIAAALFRLDAHLVSQPKRYDTARTSIELLDFVRVTPEDYTRVKERQLPKKPPPPDRPPPPPKLRVNSPDKMQTAPVDAVFPDIEMGFGAGGGPYIGQWRSGQQADVDSDVMPIVRIAPQYPREALLKGLEGWVQVEFIINADGTVRDPVVLAAEPPRMFNREALRAILRWKFKPRFIDGKPVDRRGRQVIEFKLDEEEL